MQNMRLKLLACKSLTRELCHIAATSDNILDITYMRQGYHNAPDVLRRKLQQEIDAVESGADSHTNELGGNLDKLSPFLQEKFDAVLIGYGLCSNGIVGLHSTKFPLVIPRAHDCITLFLGSKERYHEYFEYKLPGCFWYTASWIDNSPMPCEELHNREHEFYIQKGYDPEDIEFLLQESRGWTKTYKNAAYIKMPFYDNVKYSQFTRRAADFYNWDYHAVEGDMRLLEKFVRGDWDEESFLIVPPGSRVAASHDDGIIKLESECDTPL